MIIKCKSCQKQFKIQDNLIPPSGRLVQCGSCGNKWTQLRISEKVKEDIENPIKQSLEKEIKPKNIIKKKVKKSKTKNLYTKEYLEKKHGLKIINPSSIGTRNEKKLKKKVNSSFGFYSYLITFTVIILLLIGILNQTRDIIILHYPSTEIYISYFYETLSNLKIIFLDFI